MDDRTRRRHRVVALTMAAVLLVACTGDGEGDDADGPAPATTEAESDTSVFTPSDADVEDELLDEGLVPDTVDEVVLDDDVIIATDDGQVPTTTIEPEAGAADTVPPSDVTTTTAAPAPLPEASSIERVVSLSPTHTTTIAELGAADLLVGIDAFSEAPAGAPLERDQLLADDLDPAELRSLGVDLVVVGEDIGDIAVNELAEAGIPFFDGDRPTSRAGVEQQILDLAAAIGRAESGQALVADMRAEVEAILASVPPTSGLTYFHEIDPGYATYSPGGLIDSLYGELGLTSIVPASDAVAVFFDEDRLLAADPDVVVLGDIDCCGATAERAAARNGWSDLSATRNGAIVEVSDDVANRFGTNIVELMRLVAGGVAAAA